jgi:TolB-like protein/Tfp pilus assembly protein PilF
MISRGSDVHAPRLHIERGLAGLPAGEALSRYADLCSYWLGYQLDGADKSARAWLAAEPGASFPAWILAQESIARRRPDEAAKWAEQAAKDPDITGVRSLVTLFESRYYLEADLAAARAAVDRIPGEQRGVHRVIASRFVLAMAEKHYDQALQELAQTPAAMLSDRVFHGPKALLAGFAHQAAGRPEVALEQFRDSEKLLREELARDRDNFELRAVLALSLACLGRSDEARRELALVEPLLSGKESSVYTRQPVMLIAQAHGVMGETDRMVSWLRELITKPSGVPFTPASLRLDPRFGRYAAEPPVQALLAEFASLDQPVAVKTEDRGQKTEVGAPIDQKSVAVLAFANLSDDKGNEYFSDGISEELLNVLAKVPGLKVSARTSSFHFKGKDTPIPEIAAKLNVAYVVEGSVRKAGDKVRITAQLIKAADGFHVWSETFTRDLKDIFAVQDEIAGLIAKNLQLKLGDAPRAAKAVNPEAHQLYLQGKYFLNQYSHDNAQRATDLLQRAVELDPEFALAWVALSRAHSVRGGYADTLQEVGDSFSRARQAAERALALDPDLAVAHLALAEVQIDHDWNWKGAAESLRRAQTLAPADAAVIDTSARLAYAIGQREQAIKLGGQTVALDPVNPAARIYLGYALTSVRRFPEAEAEFRRVIELNPSIPWGHAGVAFTYNQQGRFEEAAAEAVLETNEWSRLYALALARWGQKKLPEADAALAQLIKGSADVAAYQIAVVHAFRHDNDRAFEWLERAYRQRDAGLAWSKSDIILESLHADPRWEVFIRKLGLTDEQLK